MVTTKVFGLMEMWLDFPVAVVMFYRVKAVQLVIQVELGHLLSHIVDVS